MTQQFRTGLSVEPQLDLLRTDDVTAGSGAVNEGTLKFIIRQPLLRGRGRAAADAGELSAERELAASGLDLRQTVAQRIQTVASQYWTAASAARNLEVLRASEESSRKLLENTRKLIEADQVPAADLVQLEANLASKESARIGGERQLFAARQGLGREIGLDAAEIAALPLPSDPFPGDPPRRRAPARGGGAAASRRRCAAGPTCGRRASARRELEIRRAGRGERAQAAARPGPHARLLGPDAGRRTPAASSRPSTATSPAPAPRSASASRCRSGTTARAGRCSRPRPPCGRAP